MQWLMDANLANPLVIATCCILSTALCGYLLVRGTWRRFALSLAGAAAGVVVGLVTVWLLIDVQNIFDVGLSSVTYSWTLFGFAGVGLGVANLFASRWWRKIIAIIAIPMLLMTAAIGVNNDIGEFRSLNAVLGNSAPPPALPISGAEGSGQGGVVMSGEHGEVVPGTVDYAKSWRPPADMPRRGVLGIEKIPATTSGFNARPAYVWLPPAALTKSPPVLPVLVVFSGQPGSPEDSFTSGHFEQVLNEYAAKHHGLAPIVVAADQLSATDANPMCVDSKAFGNSASYLTVDVPAWIRSHFRVSDDPVMWGIDGFSQGGTCAVQLVSGFPELFGSGIATSSQLGPILRGGEQQTIDQGFGGSRAAYEAAQPLAIMQKHGQYENTMLLFGTGGQDARYTAYAKQLQSAADAVGMHTKLFTEPTGHDWHTAQTAFAHAFPVLAERMGLSGAS